MHVCILDRRYGVACIGAGARSGKDEAEVI